MVRLVYSKIRTQELCLAQARRGESIFPRFSPPLLRGKVLLSRPMRILLSTFACHPEQGSESGVGWKTACLLGERYELLVLTHPRQKASIQQAQLDGKISPRVKFLFAGKDYQWHPNRLIARLQNWIEYKKWLGAASQEVSSAMQGVFH